MQIRFSNPYTSQNAFKGGAKPINNNVSMNKKIYSHSLLGEIALTDEQITKINKEKTLPKNLALKAEHAPWIRFSFWSGRYKVVNKKSAIKDLPTALPEGYELKRASDGRAIAEKIKD